MIRIIDQGLHSRSGLVRKGSALLLQAPKRVSRQFSRPADYEVCPPVLANSFPKSGTHLLDQIIGALPDRRNYGAFLSSMTSSFRFTRRTPAESRRFLESTAPGEIVRAHLFYDSEVCEAVVDRRFVHYFIYRDLRDVVLSEAHYYRSINRWHRLHRLFRDAPSMEDALLLAIEGIEDPTGRIYYPGIGARFCHYEPWTDSPDAFAVRFEDLTGEGREAVVRKMVEYYLLRTSQTGDVESLASQALANITPEKSHTFRKGKKGGWREAFNERHRESFKRLAGDLLIKHGYESTLDW
jgi:sulfotransferase 6B1